MMPGGIAFSSPAWLWLFPALLAITLLWKRSTRGRENTITTIDSPAPDTHVYHPFSRSFGHEKQLARARGTWMTVVLWTAIALLVAALSQPVRTGKQLPDPLPQRDIIFIVDTSVSMTLRDYIVDGQRVSRMTVVKGVLDEFVKNLEGSHLSLVVFGESAYTYVPLTADHEFVRAMLARIQPTMAGRFNAIGDGVALAVKNAMQVPGRHAILVLLTDADHETGTISPASAALLSKNAGLPLYTIAIGAATTSAEEERTTGLIYQPVNLDMLASMADITGANTYRAGATLELKEAISDIENREQRQSEQAPRFYRQQLYPWLLLPALLLFAIFPGAGLLRGCAR